MSDLSERPADAVVGETMPHESAALHVTGARALHRRPRARAPRTCCTPGRCRRRTPTPGSPACASSRRTTCPGVVRVLTADDVPGVNDAGIKHDEPLFPDEVMFHGHAVCWVLGETLEAARRGAAAVEVDYEPLPALVDRPRGDRGRQLPGRPAAPWSAATSRPGSPAPPTSSAARSSSPARSTSTSRPTASLAQRRRGRPGVRAVAAPSTRPRPRRSSPTCSGWPATTVTVQCLRMGGGFGGKEMQPHGYAAIAALGATLTGRPVRLRLNRTQDITMSGKRHGFHAEWRVGFDDDGRLQALDATLTSDGGWSLDLSEPVLARALCHIDNAYWIPDIARARPDRADPQDLADRVPRLRRPAGDARDRGHPRPVRPAARASTPPTCAAATSTPTARPRRTASRCGTPSALERGVGPGAATRRTSRRRSAEIAAFNAAHPHAKRGLAITPVKFGISFNFTAFNQAGALVHVYKDGSVLINHGGTEMGQGLHTKMLQVAATELGVPLAMVRLAPTRTDKVPNTSATAASSGADLNGGGDQERLRADRRPAAAGGRRRRRRTPRGRSSSAPAYFERVQLWAAGFYRTEGLHWDSTAMTGTPVQVLRVRRGRRRGRGRRVHRRLHALRRVDIVHDVGDSLSPLVDLGQIEGGFVQGAGWLTLEDLRWDSADGPDRRPAARPRRPAPTSCRASRRCRRVFNVALLEQAHEDGAVYGSKAVGEPPLMLAFCGARGAAAGVRGVRAARHQRRPRLAGDPRGGLLGARSRAARPPAREPTAAPETTDGPPLRPVRRARALDGARWPVEAGLSAWARSPAPTGCGGGPAARDAYAGVLVTVASVRGHAPREAGAKMVVSATPTWGSVGGGNLEAVGRRARPGADLARAPAAPDDVRRSTCPTRRPSSTACSAAAAR